MWQQHPKNVHKRDLFLFSSWEQNSCGLFWVFFGLVKQNRSTLTKNYGVSLIHNILFCCLWIKIFNNTMNSWSVWSIPWGFNISVWILLVWKSYPSYYFRVILCGLAKRIWSADSFVVLFQLCSWIVVLEVMNIFFSPFLLGNGNITIDFGGSRSADAEHLGIFLCLFPYILVFHSPCLCQVVYAMFMYHVRVLCNH